MHTLTNANLEALMSLNLSAILAYALKHNHKNLELTTETVIQYKRYIYLCTVSQKVLAVPSEAVDEIWHAHLLHNFMYEQMCKIGGKKIYHQPTTSKKDSTTPSTAMVDLSIEAIRYFGSPQAVGVIGLVYCTDFSCHCAGEIKAHTCDAAAITSVRNCSSCDNGCVACNGSDNGTIS